MNCPIEESRLIDYLDNTLSPEETLEIEKQLENNEACREALEETRELLNMFKQMPEITPSSNLKAHFLELLEEEKQLLATPKMTLEKEFPWKQAFQIAASILLVIAGYWVGNFHKGVTSNEQIVQLQNQTYELKQDMMLAMLDNTSPSKRIQAVSYSEEITAPDSKILEALIDRLQYDGSVNVRLAAAEALSKFSDTEPVKDAFIHSLTHDTDPNIQIAIIQFLVDIQEKRALAPMRQLLEQEETPEYVKQQVNLGLQQII